MSDQLTKVQKQIQKNLSKRHKTLFVKVRYIIRGLKDNFGKRMPIQAKRDLIADAQQMNQDLFDVIIKANDKNLKEYANTINAYLSLTSKEFDLEHDLIYKVGKMKNLTAYIANCYKLQELKEETNA